MCIYIIVDTQKARIDLSSLNTTTTDNNNCEY